MAIYRGPGGAGDAVADTTNESAVAVAKAAEAAASAAAAAVSESNAAASASDAASSATSVGDSATAAAASASSASSSASSASTSAAAASSSASSASSSASAASSSASAAASSASDASTSATAAATSATNAAESEDNAATSASSASAAASAAAAAQAAAEAAEANTVNFQENLEVDITTLSAGASATVSYDSGTTTMSFGIPAGATGADGDPGLVWKGTYASGTAYVENDAVQYDGSSYICILSSTGNDPTNVTYWELIAAKGETGASGSGAGDVVGPASAVANNLVAFDGTTGKLIKDSTYAPSSFATAAQGSLAASAVQPGDLATVATTGAYSDLSGTPTLGTAAAEDTSAFATAAQGSLADSAVQPGDNVSDLTNDAGYLTSYTETDPVVGAISGIVKANGAGTIAAAVAGTDYLAPAAIGTTVQGYDADTAKYDDTTANFTGTLQNGGSNVLVDSDIGSTVQAYNANILTTSAIGVSVQAYDSDTTKNDVTNTFTAKQTFGKALQETKVAVAASEIDLAEGNYFTKTISTNTTFTVANTASSGTVSAFVLELTNGGAATVTWFSGVTWNAATAPTLTASGVDCLAFFTVDGGTTWRGFVLGQGMA